MPRLRRHLFINFADWLPQSELCSRRAPLAALFPLAYISVSQLLSKRRMEDIGKTWHGTTILCVRKSNQVVVGGDGQVTMGQTVVKSNARKLRRLDAMMAVADRNVSLILSGTGDVLEPEDGLIGIGSGGGYALAAARALIGIDGLAAEEVVRRAMAIAAGICIYTNDKITLEKLEY